MAADDLKSVDSIWGRVKVFVYNILGAVVVLAVVFLIGWLLWQIAPYLRSYR